MLEHQPLVWAEIAVTDMDRAVAFYQRHFEVSFKLETMNDMEMAILESTNEENATIGLVKHEMMKPSLDGSTVYLHLTPTLNAKVSELEQAGVTILLPVMPISDGECGYIAIFVDSEGNKVGLWSKDL
ncbi:VOC family protein [Psychrobium sp. 1_MG-2023]|uniref:VOC family protein n=1 Tax=Psychrobium sp. 1_MG-2023 TaxID=3062624 RepID=UPI000C334014|nr:VOC family protein [Psychrobium sp. 1_MG-2023]MDP2561607.1 VOC family protein [Psychrobium sp. 1_MG-2023]PKF55626.1 glyoxalase [Alteromonadales bacterium alter-6D02]